MADFLNELKKKVVVGLVGGSDITKIAEQMAGSIDEGNPCVLVRIFLLRKQLQQFQFE